MTNVCSLSLSLCPLVSHKKLMLMRWEKTVLEKTSLPLSPPPSPNTSQPHSDTTVEPIKRHDSPLFEELSDEEFEDARKSADTADERGTCTMYICT